MPNSLVVEIVDLEAVSAAVFNQARPRRPLETLAW